jgi:hypothetical protein
MSPDPRDPVPPLQFSELRTSGVSWASDADAFQRLRIDRIELHDLKLQTPLGPLTAASATLLNLTARLRSAPQPGGPLARLAGLTVGELRLRGASVELDALPPHRADPVHKAWRLEPLAALEGALHADIADAAWVFDADVTIPISLGRIDFQRATVEHVGPDSSMGLDRKAIYVDAPNGRTDLFLLSATPVPGARFERRGGLLSLWGGDRGSIELQPFVEGLLSGVAIGTLAPGTRDMIARTRVSSELRLGDGVIGDDRDRVVLAGREQGKNRIELASTPSEAGFVLRMLDLAAVESRFELLGKVVSTGALAGTLSVQLKDFAAAQRVSASVAELTLHDIACSERPDPGLAPSR